MSYYNNNNQGYAQGGYSQGYQGGGQSRYRQGQKEEVINKWQGIGIIRAKSADPNAPIQCYSKDGAKGVIHAKLIVQKDSGRRDNAGNPVISKDEFSLDIWTNKNVSIQMLQNIIPGTKVRVVGELHKKHYQDRNGVWQTDVVIEAYVLEILATPQQNYNQGYAAPQGGYNGQNQYPQGGYPQGQGQYRQPQGGYNGQGQYPQGGNYQPSQQQYRQPQGQAQPPQQVQQPQQYGNVQQAAWPGAGQGQAQQASVQQAVTQTPPPPAIEDMPEGI